MKDRYHRAVLCQCDCGNEKEVFVFDLRNGESGSCGCLKREQMATLVTRTRWKNSHGRCGTTLYRLWTRMRKRCHNPKAHNYRWYGGRGIKVCDEWRYDAGAFIDYIEQNLGPRPDGMSLDRIDNDGDYEPGNLRWATPAEQARNRRKRMAGC